MKVTVNITPDDYWQFNKTFLRSHLAEKRLPVRLLLILIGAVLVLAVLLSALRGDLGWISETTGSGLGSVLGVLLVGAGCCFVLLVLVYSLTRRYIRNQGSEDAGVTGEHHLRIAEDGIHEKTSTSEGTHNWDAVTNVAQDRDYIFVYLGKARAHIIPKRAFAEPQSAQAFFDKCTELWRAAAVLQP